MQSVQVLHNRHNAFTISILHLNEGQRAFKESPTAMVLDEPGLCSTATRGPTGKWIPSDSASNVAA